MAEVADLFLLPLDEALASAVVLFDDDENDDYPIVTIDRSPSEDGGDDDDDSFDPFSPTLGSGLGVLDAVEDMGSDYLGLGLAAALGSQDMFLGSRGVHGDEAAGHEGGGLRIVGFDSDSDSDSEIERIGPNFGDLAPSILWDCFRIDEDRRTGPEGEFEWGEVEVDGHHHDEREALSMMVGNVGGDGSGSISGLDSPPPHMGMEEFEFGIDPNVVFDEETAQTIDWEVLLEADDLGESHPEGVVEDGELVNTSEYEIVVGQFGQFAEHGLSRGQPPAAKSVVKSLARIVLTEEDVRNHNTLCAVCKDEISLTELATRLPCLHHYHGGCIGPWLAIRNTCPVCRYELRTDDAEYEDWKARRAGGSRTDEESRIRYELDSYPQV